MWKSPPSGSGAAQTMGYPEPLGWLVFANPIGLGGTTPSTQEGAT